MIRTKNVYVTLMGGVGNQMFQYAFGRAIALKYNAELKLDLQFLKKRSKGYTKRNFRLNSFLVIIKLPGLFEKLYYLSDSLLLNIVSIIFGRKMCVSKIIEKPGCKYELKAQANKHLHFSGYWQSEAYFIHIRDLLLKEFVPKDISQKARNYSDMIRNCNSVSIHFRRGDYVSLKSANDFHGVMDLDYYYHALQLITNVWKNAVVFIFSDDVNWVKENFNISQEAHTVEGTEDFEEIYLMSMCKHNIIANSSFSWWGAWLNKNPEKIVIAPKSWFAKKEINENSKSLIPESWKTC